MRDSQRSKVYGWERLLNPKDEQEELSLAECEQLVKDVWAAYRPHQRLPRVADGRGTRNATGSSWKINLPLWSRNRITVLHETAHSLNPPGPAHGPDFVRLLIELLERWALLPRRQLLDSARVAKVKIGRTSAAERPTARVRARQDLGPRSHWHKWQNVEVLERKVQRNGLILRCRARCTECGKEIPS